MSTLNQPIRLERKDYVLVVAWTLLFLIAYAGLMSAHVLLDPSIEWVLPWKLAGISVLLVFAAQRGHYALVLGLTSAAYVLHDFPLFGLCFLVLTFFCFLTLHHTGKWGPWLFWMLLILFAVTGPKLLFLLPGEVGKGTWWMGLATTGLVLRYAWYHHEWRLGRWERPDYFKHLAYIAFLPQIFANLNYRPSQQWNGAGHYPVVFRQGLQTLGLAFLKIVSFRLLNHFGPLDDGTGTGSAWLYVLLNYLKWFLWFSAHFDLAVAFCRFMGADIPHNFRLPLLATSPIEHWRRWNIFDRHFLLALVYVPLGGSRTDTPRNVFVVFVASFLILQTGWLGATRATLDPAWLLHGLAYALAQAGLVLANREWRRRRGLDSHHQTRGWAVLPTWAATFTAMAWLHILILGHPERTFPGDRLLTASDRLDLILRACGWP